MPNRNRWLKIAPALLVIIAVAAGWIFWPQKASLEGLRDTSAQYDVRILRDEWGVPHIFGKTDVDVAYGMAYAHAEDDFLTIQQGLIAARGELASVYGLDSAPIDYFVGLIRVWDVVDAHYQSDLSPQMRAMLDAYADGLNQYALLHPEELLPPFTPFTGQDLVAASVQKAPLFFGLDKTLGELFEDERPEEISDRKTGQSLAVPRGSNTFAVSPRRSANGETFLAVNSHQPWEGPVTWYEMHLHSEEGLDVAGGTWPGVPNIIHGHNRNLGWAFTVNHPDLTDVYVLDINPDNKNQYRFDGEWLDFEVRKVPIKIKLLGRLAITVKQEALWSVYGPTVRRPHGVYAIRYAGYGDVRIFEELYRLNKATNFTEWREAMKMGALVMFNTGYADRKGNIYYLYNGRIPLRNEAYNWQLYLPGNTSETLWTDYFPFEDLPQVFNPASGFIQNANSTPFKTTIGPENPNPADYSPTLGIEEPDKMTNRALRALELFGADDSITAEEFETYKFDMTYSADSDMVKYLRILFSTPIPDEPDLQAGLALLKSWDFKTNPENPAAALVVLTVQPIAGEDDAEPEEVDPADLLASFETAVKMLNKTYGRLDVPWQEVNRLRRGETDLGLGGGPDILHAVYGELDDDNRLRGFAGDSYVMLVEWNKDGILRSRSIHQYGSATLIEDSPHYADQAPLFAQRKLKPVWLDEPEIKAHLEREYRPPAPQ